MIDFMQNQEAVAKELERLAALVRDRKAFLVQFKSEADAPTVEEMQLAQQRRDMSGLTTNQYTTINVFVGDARVFDEAARQTQERCLESVKRAIEEAIDRRSR